jgi:hypothetical protein
MDKKQIMLSLLGHCIQIVSRLNASSKDGREALRPLSTRHFDRRLTAPLKNPQKPSKQQNPKTPQIHLKKPKNLNTLHATSS